jgi:hypothetical protein
MLKMVPSARRLSLLVALAAVCGLSSFAATAGAVGSIERVWSFQEGAVDVVAQPKGAFLGVVSVATKFAKCVHPVNEQMWIQMEPQPDGSYWGLHRWYYETCVPNPTYGPTAWRVIQNQQKEEVLRVCFSAPESGSQPTIAPDGTHAHATYGCVDSKPIAPVPSATTFKQAVTLPSAKGCVRLRSLTIKLRNPKYDPLKQVVVWVNRKKVANLRGVKKLKHAIRLKHLPKGRFTVKVLAVTVLNHRLTGSRSYTGCTGASGNLNLHHHGHKHRHKHR